ncbi:PREDICTED: tumor necrosis factor receptor superfamily member 6B-like [Cyprinodon variegatus]|uniref:tumor necrosis factor receptor superfamily member 6B-like n=1 Tax=Cyprinodon variegatus TaxID=28743 RepID=UPI0007427B1B|nr:PREDICTED: tumor necrosis factor receptor superfamily member 6B-like [Cyprinodon variegatus]
MNMLSLPLLFLLAVTLCFTSADPTYEYRDRLTGRTRECNQCRPGTYVAAHCTANTPTKCEPCPNGHYTALWNYLPRCLYCNVFCTQNQEVDTECSATTNRACRCKAGFYMMDDYCFRHSECGPGFGVQTKGTPINDTVCEKCPKGYFSASSSMLDQCKKHKHCPTGSSVLLRGSALHDTICGSCESLANGGDDLRAVLSALFSGNRMQKRDLKIFIHRVLHKQREDDCPGDSALPKQRGPLLNQIRAWLAQASVEQLKELPKTVRVLKLTSIEIKLEKIILEIKERNPSCSL